MALVWKLLASAIIGYLLGDISCGVLVGKLFGHTDIREHGSGSVGTTNVLRTLGWLPSILTLIGDAAKSFIAAKLGYLIAGDAGLLLAGTCAVAGHIWPIFLGFHGGKGIATALGLIIAIDYRIAIALFLVEVIVVAISGYMSLASLANIVAYPIVTAILLVGRSNYILYLIFSIFASSMALYAHRENIRRLLHHEENRLRFSEIPILKKLRK